MESATQTAASAVFFTRDLLHHIVLFLDEDQKRVLEAVHSRAAEAVSHHLYGDISWVTHVVAMNRASTIGRIRCNAVKQLVDHDLAHRIPGEDQVIPSPGMIEQLIHTYPNTDLVEFICAPHTVNQTQCIMGDQWSIKPDKEAGGGLYSLRKEVVWDVDADQRSSPNFHMPDPWPGWSADIAFNIVRLGAWEPGPNFESFLLGPKMLAQQIHRLDLGPMIDLQSVQRFLERRFVKFRAAHMDGQDERIDVERLLADVGFFSSTQFRVFASTVGTDLKELRLTHVLQPTAELFPFETIQLHELDAVVDTVATKMRSLRVLELTVCFRWGPTDGHAMRHTQPCTTTPLDEFTLTIDSLEGTLEDPPIIVFLGWTLGRLCHSGTKINVRGRDLLSADTHDHTDLTEQVRQAMQPVA